MHVHFLESYSLCKVNMPGYIHMRLYGNAVCVCVCLFVCVCVCVCVYVCVCDAFEYVCDVDEINIVHGFTDCDEAQLLIRNGDEAMLLILMITQSMCS